MTSANPLKVAAVLVLLYEHLRTHAGQTALPGGKKDPSDIDLTMTAYREAHEEVALPLNSPYIHTLAFLSHPELIGSLKASPQEVSHIFSHPLEAILDPSLAKAGPLVDIGSEDWPYESEVYNTSDSIVSLLGNTTYRMHRFRTSASPVKGLSADILIKTAEIAYGRPTSYERYASGQLKNIADIIRSLS
ncbi:hypothetical protein BJ912DRAFT_975715 [Pholiota molesta]|nr:hypothetical protein BJ912DRAFT_975715 [Pholiota molesta]